MPARITRYAVYGSVGWLAAWMDGWLAAWMDGFGAASVRCP